MKENKQTGTYSITAFEQWPLSLLCDYVLSIHHRNTRIYGQKLIDEIEALRHAHPEVEDLQRLLDLVRSSYEALDEHCSKEEMVLFPQFDELIQAENDQRQPAPFHCGTVRAPIHVMNRDHGEELERWTEILSICANLETRGHEFEPLCEGLRRFHEGMKEHIWLEDELIFPQAIALENALCG